jgi:hypothetical protein
MCGALAAIGEELMQRTILTGAAVLALAALGGTYGSVAQAQGQDHGQSCFYSRNITSWAPVDRRTVNIRVHANEIYQLKLLGDCPNLDWINGIGLEHNGRSWICSGLDAEVLAPQPGGIPAIHCPVTSVRKLSKDEAAALPPKQHP